MKVKKAFLFFIVLSNNYLLEIVIITMHSVIVANM